VTGSGDGGGDPVPFLHRSPGLSVRQRETMVFHHDRYRRHSSSGSQLENSFFRKSRSFSSPVRLLRTASKPLPVKSPPRIPPKILFFSQRKPRKILRYGTTYCGSPLHANTLEVAKDFLETSYSSGLFTKARTRLSPFGMASFGRVLENEKFSFVGTGP